MSWWYLEGLIFLVRYIRRSFQTTWSFPFTNVICHSVAWPYTMTTLDRSDFIPNCDHITELDLLPNYERVFIVHLMYGCCMPIGDAHSSGHLLPSHLGLACVLLIETKPMERRFNIYSIIWRYLQIFEDIFKWIKDIFKSFEDLFN